MLVILKNVATVAGYQLRVTHQFCRDAPLDSDDDFKPSRKVQLTDENAQQIISKWVHENDIVLFMKGIPMSPQCGYSNHVVEILKKYGICVET